MPTIMTGDEHNSFVSFSAVCTPRWAYWGGDTKSTNYTIYYINKDLYRHGQSDDGIVHIIQVSMLASAPREINHSTRSSYPGDARVPHKEVRDARFREEEKKILYD